MKLTVFDVSRHIMFWPRIFCVTSASGSVVVLFCKNRSVSDSHNDEWTDAKYCQSGNQSSWNCFVGKTEVLKAILICSDGWQRCRTHETHAPAPALASSMCVGGTGPMFSAVSPSYVLQPSSFDPPEMLLTVH